MDDHIRIVKRQPVDDHCNQTIIILPSFAKAWELFETAMLNLSTNPLWQAQQDGLAISVDKQAALCGNKGQTIEQRQQLVNNVWKEITHGPGSDFIGMIEAVAHALMELAAQIDPSLRPNFDWKQTEVGPVFDAGLIASEDERPCFAMEQPTSVFRKGDGQAYRLLINTDTSYGHTDSENCVATISLVRCLMNFGDVELWIQQGWTGSNPRSGVTMFPIHKGQEITPAMSWFWLASSYRDGLFSRVVNFALGRKDSGVSQDPQMEHDIYVANAIGTMPSLNGVHEVAQSLRTGKKLTDKQTNQMNKLAEWLCATVKKAVYTDEAIAKMETM